MRALLIVILFAGSVAYAEPTPYTIDTKTGLESRNAERNLYDAVRRMVGPVARAMGFSKAETQCAEHTAAEALIRATIDALSGNLYQLHGSDRALDNFKRGQDDWCNKQGGKRGAEAIAPYAARAQSFVRPFLKDALDALRGKEMTPAQQALAVAAAVGAALIALPVLAPI